MMNLSVTREINKFMNSVTRGFVFLTILLLVTGCLNCSNEINKFENVDGKIIILSKYYSDELRKIVYTPNKGTIETYEDPSGNKYESTVIANFSNENLLIKIKPILIQNINNKVGYKCIIYNPTNGTIEEPDIIIHDEFIHDYDINNQQYLITKNFGKHVLLELYDRNFEMIKNLHSIYEKSYFKNDRNWNPKLCFNGIIFNNTADVPLFNDREKILYFTWDDIEKGRITKVFKGSIKGVSNDKRYMIYCDFSNGNKFVLYDFGLEKSIDMNLNSFSDHNALDNFTFSPDGKYICYNYFTSNFDNQTYLYIYDINRNKVTNVGITQADGNLGWVAP